MPDELHFRRVMATFPTGVAVVAARTPDGRPCGLTANSLASVSLRPMLILVCVDRKAASHGCIVDGGAFAVSLLDRKHEVLARRFAVESRTSRFDEMDYHTEITGSPILMGAMAWLDCRVRDVHDGGDHSIVVGEVLACEATEGDPLIFFRGEYRRVHP